MSIRGILSALIVTIVVAGSFAASTPAAAQPAHSKFDTKIESFDGTLIAITVFQPAGASDAEPVPMIVRSHGWSGSRDKTISGIVEKFLDAGYGVVTFDARGHGESGGVARVHDPDYEIRDVSKLYDWMYTNLPWALKQPGSDPADKDLVIAGSGGSYGGAWQLLSAALDGRIDVLAPEITWNSLPQSLAPNGAINSDWVHLLYLGGKARARLDPDIDRWYREVMTTNTVPADALAHFQHSSVYPYIENIHQPTLLIQGVPDTLFNLNQAVANYEGIQGNGATVKLFTHRGGHLVSAVFVEDDAPDIGFPQPGDQGSPCADKEATIIAWFNEHIKGIEPARALSNFEIATDELSCIRLDALPQADTVKHVVAPIALPAGAGSVAVPLMTASQTTRLAGIPVLRVQEALMAGVDDIAYVSLVVVKANGAARTVSSQVTPLHLSASATNVALDMGGIGTTLEPGEALMLKVDRVNEFYATNSGRWPGALMLRGVSVGLPVAP